MASYNTTVRQITETSQRKKTLGASLLLLLPKNAALEIWMVAPLLQNTDLASHSVWRAIRVRHQFNISVIVMSRAYFFLETSPGQNTQIRSDL